MTKFGAILVCGITLVVAGCGDNATERAATGAGAGALVAGPVGAAGGAILGGTGAVEVNP